MITPSFGLTATERVLPKLALDFTTASLDSRVTFTRTTSTSNPATYTDNNGYIALATNNQPRFDYNPVTLICKGLLIEESRTNLFTYSEDFTGWTFSQASVVSSAITSPANDLTTTKLLENTATAQHLVRKSISVTSGTSYTVSIYAKKAERDWLFIVGGGNAGSPSAYFDLTNGVVGTVGSGTVATMSNAGNGFYRCTISKAATVTGNALFSFAPATSNGGASYAGNDPSTDPTGIYIWGAQLEAGAFPTSYIPTEATALTRNADVATMTGTNFSDWWQATRGSALVKARTGPVSGTRPWMQFDDNTANKVISIRGNTTNPELYIKDTTDQAQIDAGTIATNISYRFCGSWNTNSCAASINGGLPLLDGVATIPTVTQARLGSDGTNYFNGHIESFEYYEERLLGAATQVTSSTAGYRSIITPLIRDAIIS